MTENRRIAFIFPGQGESHYIGMGKDFYATFPIAKQIFDEADDLLNFHLTRLIFNGNIEELTNTKNCQIALYVNSIAILKVIESQFPDLFPYVCSGLSLGEYSAATAAGILNFSDGVTLVRHRGVCIQEACEQTDGTMAVILGLNSKKVLEMVEEMNLPSDLWVANLNCPGQVVISGTRTGVESGIKAAKDFGAKRVLPLNVSGAFHSSLMAKAEKQLENKVMQTTLNDDFTPIVMNVTGQVATEKEMIRKNLIKQVTHTVKWEGCVRSMLDMDIRLFIEIGCGTVLAGLNKRIGVAVPTLSIDKVKNLETLSNEIKMVEV